MRRESHQSIVILSLRRRICAQEEKSGLSIIYPGICPEFAKGFRIHGLPVKRVGR